MLSGGAAAVAFTLVQEPEYRSEARVLIEEPRSPLGMLSAMASVPMGLSGVLGAAPPTAAEMEIARSRPVVAAVLRPRGETEDAPGVGLGLLTRVDDLDLLPLWKDYRRRLRGEEEPRGSLAVDVRRWGFPEKTEVSLRLSFRSDDEVEVSLDRWFGARPAVLAFEPGQPLEYEAATLVLRPEGDLAGRTFRVTHSGLQRGVKEFLDDLVVRESTRGSNVVQLVYSDVDGERAAAALNELVRAYRSNNQVRLVRSANRSVGFMEDEIERIRGELHEAEADLQALAEEVGPLALPETAEALVEKLVEVDLERAKHDLAARATEEMLQRIRRGDVEPGELAGLELAAGFAHEQVPPLGVLLAERSALQALYTEDWPDLRRANVELEERIRGIESVLESRAWRDSHLAADLDSILDRYHEEMQGLPEAQIRLVRHKRRVEAFSQIFLFLLGQLQEAKVAEASAVPHVEIVELAEPPLRRHRPSLRLNLTVGAVIGLLAALWLAFLRELSRPVTREGQLALAARAPVLGRLPKHGARPDHGVGAPAGESLRALRETLRAAASGAGARSIGVVSAVSGEGRSLVAASLATSLARSGVRTLLVDADLGRPSSHERFGLGRSPGVGEVLAGEVSAAEAVADAGDGLALLPAGDGGDGDLWVGGRAGALLAELKASYELVLVDLPDLERSSDAAVLGPRLDGLLLVARAERTPEGAVARAADALRGAGGSILGCVLNGTRG